MVRPGGSLKQPATKQVQQCVPCDGESRSRQMRKEDATISCEALTSGPLNIGGVGMSEGDRLRHGQQRDPWRGGVPRGIGLLLPSGTT